MAFAFGLKDFELSPLRSEAERTQFRCQLVESERTADKLHGAER